MSDIGFLQQGLQVIQSETLVHSTLNELVQLAVNAARSEAGSLFLLDEERQVLKIAVAIGLPDEYVKGCGDIALGDQCCGRAAQQKKAWVVTDMLTDPLFASAREASVKSGIRAAFSVPVIDAQGKVLGSAGLSLSETFLTNCLQNRAQPPICHLNSICTGPRLGPRSEKTQTAESYLTTI